MLAKEQSSDLLNRLETTLRKGKEDWCFFARYVLGVDLDPEQEEILRSVQHNKMTSVASGTARGKDFVAAVAAICFMYNTPSFRGEDLVGNTKVALTAPTDRQILNIMMPEIARIQTRMVRNGFGFMAGRLTAYGIQTDYKEWFLTGFKADEHNHEAWSGFHAVNTMFIVTEASGMAESVFDAIEGNLQGNSRILIVFNYNKVTGYAARSQSSPRWVKFRLNSMSAPNVIKKEMVIPGQVDWAWVDDKVHTWCIPLRQEEVLESEGDFQWEERWFRPNDLFRIKVLGLGPKESEDVMIPKHWIELANERWNAHMRDKLGIIDFLRLGADVAGMGRDSSCLCPRYGDYVEGFQLFNSGGKANHMEQAGKIKVKIEAHNYKVGGKKSAALIDTIGEGAGVFSRLEEQAVPGIYSCKYSESAEDGGGKPLTDQTGQLQFANMKAYLFWAVRDWLDPTKGSKAMIPKDDLFLQEAAEIKWKFQSNGKIIMESKDDLKKRLGRSPDRFDALANTFYPWIKEHNKRKVKGIFK